MLWFFNFYLVSPYNAGFVSTIGSTFTYTGPSTATGTMELTDAEAGGEGLVLDDNVANDKEQAIATVDNGTNVYTGVSVSADAAWTLYDPVNDVTFEAVLLSVDRPRGASLSYLLSEYPMVNGQTYQVIDFSNQPDFSDGSPVFTYDDYVCFTRDTLIATEKGEVPVQHLKSGDLVLTADAGFQPLLWTGCAETPGHGRATPVRFEAGVFGNENPVELSPCHRVALSGTEVEIITGTDEVLVAAKFLTGLDGVADAPRNRVEYFHLLLEEHHLLKANGLWSESFHPGRQSEVLLSPAQKREITAQMPRLSGGFENYGPSARPSLKSYEARALVDMISRRRAPMLAVS